jgi:Pentapeptide repeats (8 copies)
MSWLSQAWDWYAAHSDKVNPLVAGLGGAALVWAAVRQARTATNRHYEQTRADQQRRLTESFSKAVEQLAGDKIEARLGGIYTLERLAIEAIAQVRSAPWWRRLHRNGTPPADPVSDLYWTVMETLTAFVRERARWEEPELSEPEMAAQSDLWQSGIRSDQARQQRPSPSTDIAAVLAVLRRRPDAGRGHERLRGWRLDLRMTDLCRAYLAGAHLEGANLYRAHLEGANLYGAHLEGARLVGANLEGANLYGAHLEGAVLIDAHLEGARLVGANLEGARLDGAHLEGAVLIDAHLEGANLYGAHLEGANLREASGDAETRLPDGIERLAHWPPWRGE